MACFEGDKSLGHAIFLFTNEIKSFLYPLLIAR